MQTFKIAMTILVALVLQLLLGRYLAFFGYADFPLLVTVYFSLQRVPLLGMTVGLLSGLAGDKLMGSVLGVGGFSKTLIGYVIAVASIKFPLENRLARIGVVAFASVINTLLFIGLYAMLEQPLPLSESWHALFESAGYRALADTAVALVIFLLLDKIFPERAATGRVTIKRRVYD